MEQISLDWGAGRTVYTVTELSAAIRDALAKTFTNIWVAGEISGVKPAASGHVYFTLKDAASQIRCVCFKSALRWLRFKPQEGVAVLARGRVDVYEPRGEYQMIVEALEPQGYGALQMAFEQLKEKLDREGLFSPERKRALPAFPSRIGIVTSPSGAVIRDVIEILGRRFPGLHLRLYPAQVQGAGSVEQVVEAIEHFGRTRWADVVIVCRGGGSLEDLWTFNEEAVARAIAACTSPVISAVGHETDFTIADFVADVRAPTPSAAAEMVIRAKVEVEDQLQSTLERLLRGVHLSMAQAAGRVHQLGIQRTQGALGRRIGRTSQRVDELGFRMRSQVREVLDAARRRCQQSDGQLRRRDPRVRLGEARLLLQAARARIVRSGQTRLAEASGRMRPLVAALSQMNPARVLDRGYAIALKADGTVLRDSDQVVAGDDISLRLAHGGLAARVTSTTPNKIRR